MKIESIYHSKDVRRKECKGDRRDKMSSKNPIHHPFGLEREYVQALNSTKIERMLASPFIVALSHHKEGINKLVKSYSSSCFASSSYDNRVILWDLKTRNILVEREYNQIINGMALDNYNNIFVTQGKSIEVCRQEADKSVNNIESEFKCNSILSSIDSMGQSIAAGGFQGVSLFDTNRLTPKNHYELDDVTQVKFNRSFSYIMGALTGMSINLYDNRSCKSFIEIKTEGCLCLSFNLQRGYTFAVGNDDGNAYLYDIRNPELPVNTFRGHTNSVVSIAFSPNGDEIATGSFDRTIRLFNINERKPRDCYYNDRMQMVHGVEFSNDGKFVVSGSDDSSLRLWKAHAGKKVGPVSRTEKEAIEYADTLKNKFKNIGEISRISHHRFLNKEIKNEMRIKHEMHEGKLRRQAKKEKQAEFEEKLKLDLDSED